MGTAVTILLILLFLGIARYFFPVYQEDFDSQRSFEELELQYRKYDWWVILYLIIFIPLVTMLLGYVFQEFAQIRNTLFFSDYEKIIIPEFAAWCIPGLAWSFFLALPFSNWFGKKVLKINFSEYYQYADLRYGFDNRTLAKGFATFFLVISLIATPIFFNTYSIFYPKQIVVNKLTQWQAKSYDYTQIKALLKVNFFRAPNGDIKNSPKYLILWKDGEDWNANWNGLPDLIDQVPLFDFLSQKTGQSIIEVELLEDYLPE